MKNKQVPRGSYWALPPGFHQRFKSGIFRSQTLGQNCTEQVAGSGKSTYFTYKNVI